MDVKFPADACARRETTVYSDKCVFVLPSVAAYKKTDEKRRLIEVRDIFFEIATENVTAKDGCCLVALPDVLPIYTAEEYGYAFRSATFVAPYETTAKLIAGSSTFVPENFRATENRIIYKSGDGETIHIPRSRFIRIDETFGEVCVTDPKKDSHTFFYMETAHMKKSRGGFDIFLPTDSVVALYLSTHTETTANIRETEPIKAKDLVEIYKKRKEGKK